MTQAKRVQLRRGVSTVTLVLMLTIAVALVAAYAQLLFEPGGTDPTSGEIKSSAELPVMLWCMGWPIALGRRAFRVVMPLLWSLGCVLAWLHIAIAFHLGHGWSHQTAWEHTKQIGGYGDGIYVNYLFALVWLADALWACVAFNSYRARPRRLNWTVHGFLAFVVVNAAVVFGSWDSRISFFGPFLCALAFVVYMKWRQRRLST